MTEHFFWKSQHQTPLRPICGGRTRLTRHLKVLSEIGQSQWRRASVQMAYRNSCETMHLDVNIWISNETQLV